MTSLTVARGFCIVASSVLLANCALSTDPTANPQVSLVLQQTDELGIITPGAEVRDRDVVLRGTFSTPCLGYSVTADAMQKSAAVEITLRGRQVGEICLTAIGRFSYTATVSGVTAGSRRIIVRHVIEDANWPAATVVDTTVQVP